MAKAAYCARRRRNRTPARMQRGPVTDVAEHHAEHQHERHREEHGGVDLAITRHAVIQHQACERLKPAVVPDHRGNAQSLIAARIARAQDKAVVEARLEHPFQARRLAARYPPARRHQAAAPSHQACQLGIRRGARENMRRIDQAFMQALLCPFAAAARIFLRLFLGHTRQTFGQFAAHLVRAAAKLGGNVHGPPAGGLEHALDFSGLADGAGDDHVHLFFIGEETDGDVAG